MTKVFAFASFALLSIIVLCNILISIHNAKNVFKTTSQHSSFIPILDAIFFTLGLLLLCSKKKSFFSLIAMFVGSFLILQLIYYLVYIIALKMMRIKYKDT